MIRLIMCIRRRADVDPMEFRRSWVTPMRTLADELALASGANQVELSVLLSIPENAAFVDQRGLDQPYDAVVELCWDGGAQVRGAGDRPEVKAVRAKIRTLNEHYVDAQHSCTFFADDVAADEEEE